MLEKNRFYALEYDYVDFKFNLSKYSKSKIDGTNWLALGCDKRL